VQHTKVTDLSPLREMPLYVLRCDFKYERDADILRSIKTLETINDKPVKEFWKEYEMKKAFVVLARDGKAEQAFPTLKDAVEKAQSGDSIEICGDGPFPTEPINLDSKKLTIRAAAGRRPVISLDPAFRNVERTLIASNTSLVLEGLDIRTDSKAAHNCHLIAVGEPSSLIVRHCRLVSTGAGFPIVAHHSPMVEIWNTEVIGASKNPVHWAFPSRGKMLLEQSILTGTYGLACSVRSVPVEELFLNVRACTIVGENALGVGWYPQSAKPKSRPSFTVDFSGNVLHAKSHLVGLWDEGKTPEWTRVALDFLSCWKWKDGTNLLGPARPFLLLQQKPYPEDKPVRFPEDWKAFWKSESVPGIVGEPRFAGVDPLALTPEARVSLSAADYRLADGSPGKGLGADVDKVGPGKPYDEWKKTPEYKKWCEEIDKLFKGP
jgi:hypothetical protein